MSFELLVISLLVLLLVLMVLLVLFWILKHSRNKNLTELRISAGRPARVLTIRTEPDKAQEMLDHLLDRVFLLVEPGPQSGEELEEEPGSDSGSAGWLPKRTKALDKLWTWMTAAAPPAAPPPHSPLPPPPPPASQDETEDQWLDAFQHVFLSPQGATCSASGEEEKHYELKV